MNNILREKFEDRVKFLQYGRKPILTLEKDSDGDYINKKTHEVWHVWKDCYAVMSKYHLKETKEIMTELTKAMDKAQAFMEGK